MRDAGMKMMQGIGNLPPLLQGRGQSRGNGSGSFGGTFKPSSYMPLSKTVSTKISPSLESVRKQFSTPSMTPLAFASEESQDLIGSSNRHKMLQSRTSTLQQLKDLGEDDIRWTIEHLLRVRPNLRNLIKQCISDKRDSLRPSQMVSARTDEEIEFAPHRNRTTLFMVREHMAQEPVVRFAKAVQFQSPDLQYADLDVTRIGNLTKTSTIRYKTHDSSVDSYKVYHQTSGSLTFEPGESFKSIQVELIDNPEWNPPIDFRVELLKEGLEGATLADELTETRVQVLDTGTFPSTRYEGMTFSEQLDDVSHFGLAFEFFRMLWSNPGIRRGMIKTILADASSNLHYLVKTCAQMYLADFVLNHKMPESRLLFVPDRHLNLAMVAVIMLCPQFLMHAVAYKRCFGIGRLSRNLFHRGLFCMFLNYSHETLGEVHEGDLIMGMGRDVLDVVDNLLYGLLDVLQLSGLLFLMCLIQLVTPLVLHEDFHPMTLIPTFVFAVLQLVFITYREAYTAQLLDTRDHRYAEFVESFTDAINNYRLANDFKCKAQFLQRFEPQIGDYNTARREARHAVVNNKQFSVWLATLAVSLYAYWYGLHVVRGELALGVFLVNIHIIKDTGAGYSNVYMGLLRMQSAIPALMRLTNLLNQKIDLSEHLKVRRYHHIIAEERISKLHADFEDYIDEPLVDKLNFEVGDFAFNYDNCELMFNGIMQVKQGSCVHLVGPHNQGKTVLLQLIGGGLLLPVPQDPTHSEAKMFVPPHLTVLHVSGFASFFRASLLDNLLIGANVDDPEKEVPRVMKICSRLGLSQKVLDYILEGDALVWHEKFSHEETALLHFARGLIASPEVLCFERHWMGFDDNTTRLVDDLIKEFIKSRGVEQDASTKHTRRPRTVFITENGADLVEDMPHMFFFHVSRESGIRQITKEELSEDMLA